MANRRILVATFVFALIIETIIFVANMGAMPETIKAINNFPLGDKIAHFLLMGMMSLLLNLALSAKRIGHGRRSILLGSLILLVVVTGEELIQIAMPTRSFSWGDLLADYAGILVFGWMATLEPSARAVRLKAKGC